MSKIQPRDYTQYRKLTLAAVKNKVKKPIATLYRNTEFEKIIDSLVEDVNTALEDTLEQVPSDWNQADPEAKDYIKNKPDLDIYVEKEDLASVATSGDYEDLLNNPDLSIYAESANLATVATSGSYDDLDNKPNLANVATSGEYDDLLNKPTIPTKTSDLTNDSDYITLSQTKTMVEAERVPRQLVLPNTTGLTVADLIESIEEGASELDNWSCENLYCTFKYKVNSLISQPRTGKLTIFIKTFEPAVNPGTIPVINPGTVIPISDPVLPLNPGSEVEPIENNSNDIVITIHFESELTTTKYEIYNCYNATLDTLLTEVFSDNNKLVGSFVTPEANPESGKEYLLTSADNTIFWQEDESVKYIAVNGIPVEKENHGVNIEVEIPTKLSDLEDDIGIASADELAKESARAIAIEEDLRISLENYYTKAQTYTKDQVDQIVANFGSFEVVPQLPTENIKTNVIYLVPKQGSGTDVHDEYIYLEGTPAGNWELIGSTQIDLTNYVQFNDLSAVATTGAYSDLSGAPALATVATSGDYEDLTNKPIIANIINLNETQTTTPVSLPSGVAETITAQTIIRIPGENNLDYLCHSSRCNTVSNNMMQFSCVEISANSVVSMIVIIDIANELYYTEKKTLTIPRDADEELL